jgi:deoxyadenosine/deoxycytidine kinase
MRFHIVVVVINGFFSIGLFIYFLLKRLARVVHRMDQIKNKLDEVILLWRKIFSSMSFDFSNTSKRKYAAIAASFFLKGNYFKHFKMLLVLIAQYDEACAQN